MSLLGTLRCRVEGLVFVLILVAFLPAAMISFLYACSRGRAADAWCFYKIVTKRWCHIVRHGLVDFRKSWWLQLSYEKKAILWRHVILIEMLGVKRIAGGKRTGEESRILVIKLAHFGDALHIGPMLEQLAEARPNARIDVIVGPWCVDVVKRMKGVDRVISYTPQYELFTRSEQGQRSSFWQEWMFLCELMNEKYGLVLSTSVTNLPELLLIQASVKQRWLGASCDVLTMYPEIEGAGERYDHWKYEADRVAGMLSGLGIEPKPARLEFNVTADEDAWAKAMSSQLKGNLNGLLIVAPTAGWPDKAWLPKRFAEVASRVVREDGWAVALIGGPSECHLVEDVKQSASCDIVNLCGKTTLGQLAALMKYADVFLGNDSGPMHLAAAARIPSVVIFGPTIISKWAPKENCTVIQKGYACTGCVSWHPRARCLHGRKCMELVTVEEVVSALRRYTQPLEKVRQS